jgi:glycosyltransferase involved in cell wall biosynthesis
MAINTPTVSLLVAMFNEANYIEGCLKSILAQDYPAEKR